MIVTLLRARGTLARRGNDMVVFHLAKRLRDWTGIEDDPLRLIEATGSWSAVSRLSSDLPSIKRRFPYRPKPDIRRAELQPPIFASLSPIPEAEDSEPCASASTLVRLAKPCSN